MINFRYHLVSVTAVFLALTIGLVLGTTALNGPTMDALSVTVNSLRNDNEQLRDEVSQLEDDASEDHNFAAEVAPATLAGGLEDEKIAVVSVGGADPAHVEDLMAMLDHTDAKVVGQLNLTDAFTDPANSAELTDLVVEMTPKDYEPPNNNDGLESASALLAESLVKGSDVDSDDRDSIVEAMDALEMLSVGKKLGDKATGIVVVTGKPYSEADAVDRNTNVFTFADQFSQAGSVVLASPTIVGDGNVVRAVLGDESVADEISTVDNVSSPEGQLAAVLALSERIDGDVGHYGTGEAATALVPQSP
ncbi:MAG TPA: copper transporter [Candidatus Stackebrandtia faecavium]|nr:copper transporter [Candidatus Stackebrandtia faecavium]